MPAPGPRSRLALHLFRSFALPAFPQAEEAARAEAEARARAEAESKKAGDGEEEEEDGYGDDDFEEEPEEEAKAAAPPAASAPASIKAGVAQRRSAVAQPLRPLASQVPRSFFACGAGTPLP